MHGENARIIHRANRGTGQGCLPFSGLGFDLTAVAARAACLALVPAGKPRRGSAGPVARMRRPDAPLEWRPYGWGLLLRLCRETGGR